MDFRLEGEEFFGEVEDDLGLGKLIVFNDVPSFSGLFQVIRDERFGFENEFVVDGAWHDEDVGADFFLDEVAHVGVHAHDKQP